MRLVSMTAWSWPKPEVEYDRNRGTLHVWTRPNMTTTNIQLLNMTENDWIWPNFKIIFITKEKQIPQWGTCLFFFRSYSNKHVCRCGNFFFFRSSSTHSRSSLSRTRSCSQISVKLFRSSSFGHVNIPLVNLRIYNTWLLFLNCNFFAWCEREAKCMFRKI